MRIFTIDDLDNREPGLGDKIRRLVFLSHSYPSFLEKMKEVLEQLENNEITANEVIIDEKDFHSITLQGLLEHKLSLYQPSTNRPIVQPNKKEIR